MARAVRAHVLGEPVDAGGALADLEEQLREALGRGVSIGDVETLLRRLGGRGSGASE